MKTRRYGIGVVVLAAGLAAGCRDNRRLDPVDGYPALSPRVIDFGHISIGTRAEQMVQLEDDGRAPLEVVAIHLTNAAGPFSAEPLASVVPGSGGRVPVRVQFHPVSEGPFDQRLWIVTSSNTQPVASMEVRGVGAPAAIRMEPRALDFGGVEMGDERGLDLTVDNPTDMPLRLDALPGPGDFQLSVSAAAPLSRTQVHLTFKPSAAASRRIALLATPCPTCTPARATAQGQGLTSALAIQPDPLVFNGVPVHDSAEGALSLTNISWRPLQLDRVEVDGTDFAVLAPLAPVHLDPGQSVQTSIRFVPQHLGDTFRQLRAAYQSFAFRLTTARLVGRAGGPQIAATPRSLAFDDLPVGGKQRLLLYVSNAGTIRALALQDARIDPGPFAVTGPLPVDVPPGGGAIALFVDFEPVSSGQFAGTVHLFSDDPATPDLAIALTGSSHGAGPCRFKVTPEAIDFGNVPPGTGAVLGFRFEDTGSTECAVKDIRLGDSGGGAFFMPGGAIVGGDLFPTDAFSAQVAFRSPGPGKYEGTLELTVNDPAAPEVRIPLHALSAESCLSASPPYIDFGAVRFDCSPPVGSTVVTNVCTRPTTVQDIHIGPGTLPELVLAGAPPVPLPLQPGQTFQLKVRFLRNQLGQHYAPLFVGAAGEPAPLLVPLLAETLHQGIQVDRFTQGNEGKTDALFVISNTDTMLPYQQRLEAAAPALVQAARAQGIDLHLGVTTTGLAPSTRVGCPGGAQGGEAGRLFPADHSSPRILRLDTPDLLGSLARSLDVGTCQNLEQGLEAMRLALSPPLIDHLDDPLTPAPLDGNFGFSRDDARLVVVVLADEDDHSGYDAASYAQFLRSLKGPGSGQRASLYAIVPQGACSTAGAPGPRFASVAAATGGAVEDVCDLDYGNFLAQIAQRALGLQDTFPLTAVPDGTGIELTLDGQPAPGGDWYYEPINHSIVFNPGHAPPPGTVIQASYRAACQG